MIAHVALGRVAQRLVIPGVIPALAQRLVDDEPARLAGPHLGVELVQIPQSVGFFTQILQRFLMFRNIRQVVQLVRIGLQIEQLCPVPGRVVDQLVSPRVQHPSRRLAFVALRVEGLAFVLANHRSTRDQVRNLDSSQVQKRWHDVLPADQTVIHTIPADSLITGRPHQQHRDVGRVLIIQPLRPQPVLPEHISVVGRERDDRVIKKPFFAKRSDDQPQLVIDVCAQGVERSQASANLMLRVAEPAGSLLLHSERKTVKVPSPFAPLGRRRLHILVHLPVVAQRHERRMGMHVGQIPEPRAVGIAPPDHAAHLASRPIRHMALFRQVPRPSRVLVVAHPVVEAPAAIALRPEEVLVVIRDTPLRPALFGEDHVIESDAVSLRINVNLADRVGLIPSVAKRLGHRR